MSVEIIFTKPFDRSFAQLGPVLQKAVDLAVMAYRRSPDLPGLNLEKLQTRSGRLYSIRANDDVRVIIGLDGSKSLLMYVGHHKQAYQWAKRHKFELNMRTGSMQIFEIVEAVERTYHSSERALDTPAAPSPLFQHVNDDTMLDIGLPPEWLGSVRAIATPDELVDLIGSLPEEAWESLEALARGEAPPRRPTAPKGGDPYATPDARRAFRVLDGEQALQQALSRPWPEWAVWLHPSQRDAVQAEFSGPARATGQAGTGKSIVAIHRAARLARAGGVVLLTTFSKLLGLRLGQALDMLLADDLEARRRVDVRHLHAVASALVRAVDRRADVVDEREIARLLARHGDEARAAGFSDAFLAAEWSAVIDYWGIRSAGSYRAATRIGRGRALQARDRDVLWGVFGAVRADLDAVGLISWADLCEESTSRLSNATRYDYVIVDEAQDFGPRELALTVHLCRHGADGLFFTGDLGQRIYKYPFAWTSLGVDVRGRSRRLRVNYRTSAEIRAFADALLPASVEEIGGGEALRGAVSLFRGPALEVVGCQGVEAEHEALSSWMRRLLDIGARPHEIAVLARTRRRAETAANSAAATLGLRRQRLDGAADGAVIAGTLHGAKGLEFRAVAIVGCGDRDLPNRSALAAQTEPDAQETVIENERQLLYVGCTRAREALLITYSGAPTRFLAPTLTAGT